MTIQGNEKENSKYPKHIERPANKYDDFKFCCLDLAKEELDRYGGQTGQTEEISISSSELQEGVKIVAYDTIEGRNSGSVKNRGEK